MRSRARIACVLVALAITAAGVVAASGRLGSEGSGSATAVGVEDPATSDPRPEGEKRSASEVAPKPQVADGAPRRRAAALRLAVPRDASPVVWVRAGERVEIRTEPGGGELVETVRRRTEFGSPSVFGVVRREGRWAGVSTPALPNGELGWVELDRRGLGAGWTRDAIVVDLSERRAEVYLADRLVHSFTVTIGAPESPTPTGRFAVTDTFRGGLDRDEYGCCALALSANQPHLPSGWLGGSRIAIHGTDDALGVAESHGCVRAADEDVSKLVGLVDLGTPVWIRA